MMKVLVAIDDSDASFHALNWVLDTVILETQKEEEKEEEEDDDSSTNSIVTLVHVMEPFPRYAFPGGYVVESVSRAQEQNATRIISRAFQICKDKRVKAKTLLVEGDPKQMICLAAERKHYDLLVIGSRGLGNIKRALLGSVSDYCSHHADCPVLIVKPPKAGQGRN